MRPVLTVSLMLLFLAGFVLIASPAQAANTSCIANPGHGPVGSSFVISCGGFDPGVIVNVYAVEPDGRASGINIYGFFPTSVKTDSAGVSTIVFHTEFPAFASVPPGDYTFVMHELDGAGGIAVEGHAVVTVDSSPRSLVGAWLNVSPAAGRLFNFLGGGFAPLEAVNIWVTQPPAAPNEGPCSGLGIDQLFLATLGANTSSAWEGPGTIKADSTGQIAFQIVFFSSACTGEYTVSARALGSGSGAEAGFDVTGLTVAQTGASVWVSPNSVPALHSFHSVSGSGFPPNSGLNCWYTRPDGRVLSFISANTRTDSGGSFTTPGHLDDFPPFTSTEPGKWAVTCATPDRSALGIGWFDVFGLLSDP